MRQQSIGLVRSGARTTVPLALLAAVIWALAWPPPAAAHGPVAPVASSYRATVSEIPPGFQTKVIDGDQRMWLRAPNGESVVVLDYRGAPYVRYSPGGVEVNRNSAMYYLNQTPAEQPPANLGRATPPRWARVSSSREYEWHDGRLHALAGAARLPGAALVGHWSIPVLVDGRLRSIDGGLWHAPDPPLVWFWPIVVLLACVLAARRLRIPKLDTALARALAAAALVGIAVSAVGRELHGRPSVSVWQLILLAALAAFVAWALRRLVLRRHGYFFFFIVAIVAVWSGVVLLPVLLDGFVLLAVPAFVARTAAVLSLGSGVGLLLLAFRLADRPADQRARAGAATAAVLALAGMLVAGCGSSHRASATTRLPANLVAESRPIGRGASFHPPVSGTVIGPCRRRLGSRVGVHVELFAADRVVIVASGIGTRPPLRFSAGRISSARCYGELVTLEPTGVVQVAPGARLRLADLFRSWGQPLSSRRLASFRTHSVEVFVDGRRTHGPPGRVPLTAHSEIVLEAGPHVPPHRSYTFPPGT